jgi:DNA (cytosine-5)-methyltransferase 1
VNVGSLFAGIGGFDLGFERCGMRVLWQVEKEPYCRAVLARHFPEAVRFEDVREVGAHDLEKVDLICGGFPCQDLSSAGKGAGLDGARSGLWAEFARIVRELRPRYVVVENVPALLTGKGKRWARAPIGRVLGDLAEVGYDAEWACLSAREFGAPHLRKRIWIVAYPAWDAQAGAEAPAGSQRQRAGQGGARCRAGEGPDAHARRLPLLTQLDGAAPARRQTPARREHPDGLRDALPDADRDGRPQGLRLAAGRGQRAGAPDALGGGQRRAVADAEGEPERTGLRPGEAAAERRRRSPHRRRAGAAHPWAAEPDVGRVADGVPHRVDRLAALGNALVPQIAEWIGRRIIAHEEQTMSEPGAPRAGEGRA